MIYIRNSALWGPTYYFNPVAREGGQSPGASLLAGVGVRPVGAAEDARQGGHYLVAPRWKRSRMNLNHHQTRDKTVWYFWFSDQKFPRLTLFLLVPLRILMMIIPLLNVDPKDKNSFSPTAERYLPCSRVYSRATQIPCGSGRCSSQRC